MSLTPIRKSHSRHRRRPARLESGSWRWGGKGGGNWNFSFNPKEQANKFLELFSKKWFVLAIVISFALVAGTTYIGATNEPPGRISIPCNFTFVHGAPCTDPVDRILSFTAPHANLDEFHTRLAFYGGACPFITGSPCMRLSANTTDTAEALSISSMTLQTALGKTFGWESAFQIGDNVIIQQNAVWGAFLTSNGTLPTTKNYDPLQDPSVQYANVFFCNNGGGCNTTVASPIVMESYALRNIGGRDTLWGENNNGLTCPNVQVSQPFGATSCYFGISNNNAPLFHKGVSANDWAWTSAMNYTGATIATNGSCNIASGVLTGPGCSWLAMNATGTNIAGVGTQSLPIFNFQSQQFYVGYFVRETAVPNVYIPFDNGSNAIGTATNAIISYVPAPSAPVVGPQIDLAWLWNAFTGGAGINYNFLVGQGALAWNNFIQNPTTQGILSAFEQGLTWFGQQMINAVGPLGVFLVIVLNAVGSFFGLGNIGTTLQTLISQLVLFFASGNFASIIGNMPAIFSRLIDALAVFFPWLPTALTVALNIATLGVNSIVFLVSIIGFMFSLVSAGFVIYLIIFYFVYTGDNALGGFLAFLETTQWLIFGLGLKFLAYLVNFILDIVTAIVGFIPKPFIQMVSHALPRIPIVEVNARFVQPSGDMAEIRNGNLLAVALWVSGILFLDMYESASPALPGSIGALLPAALPGVHLIAAFLPLLEIMTSFVWLAAFLMVPFGYIASAMELDVPFETAAGAHISGGPGGFRIHRAEKRFQGRLNKKFGQRQADKELVKETLRINKEAEAKGLTQNAEVARLKAEQAKRSRA